MYTVTLHINISAVTKGHKFIDGKNRDRNTRTCLH